MADVRIIRASDSPFKVGDVISEAEYIQIAYRVWTLGGEIPLAIEVNGSFICRICNSKFESSLRLTRHKAITGH